MNENDTFAIAYKYHMLGRCVIPSGGGRDGKSALILWKSYQTTSPTDAQLDAWQKTLKPSIWAMLTGPVSRLFAVDCDSEEANAMMEAEGLKPHVSTGKGFHYYVHWPPWTVRNSSRLLPGIDIRGDGGYVNFCGSNAKVSYKVLIMPTDGTLIPVEKLPAQLKGALRPKPKTVVDRIYQEALRRAQPGNRNDTGLWLACQLRDNGLTQTEAENVMLRYVAAVGATGVEPYTNSEAIATLNQAYSRPARGAWQTLAPISKVDSFNRTDLGNAERMVKYHGDILHYCYECKRWLVWNDRVWEWDIGDKVTAIAKLTVRNIYREAGNEPDEKKRKQLAEHARQSESAHRINAMINLAESEPRIPVKLNELDANPWLFNCANGTIDLKTGQLLSPRREDLLTIIVPVEYQPDAQCPRWLTFLDRVIDGNVELQGYLQRAVGYSLTGNTKNQVLFFLYGLGNNGKSTFTTTIRKLMGGYGERVNPDLFMVRDKNTGGPKEGLANLKGKRYVLASELEEGKRLTVSLLKDMTGGETIKADRKYEHEIEYQPTHKLWLVSNHKPVITDTTLSIWRRVKLIPFTVTIPDNQIDPDLPSKLETELPGILGWAVRGCLDWQQHGLQEPHIVTSATATYRHEQDVLGDFIEDCCILEALASIPKVDLKGEYERWCENNNSDPVSQRTFRARLIEKGITDSRTGGKRYWRGIRLRTDADNDVSGDKSDKTSGGLASEVTRVTEKSVKFLYKEKQKKFMENPVTVVTDVTNNDVPDPLIPPCSNCGSSDYWLTDWNEWLCSRCHPKPKGVG
jgi:putative DNA primase/helicase